MRTPATSVLRILAWVAIVGSIGIGIAAGTLLIAGIAVLQGIALWAILTAFAENVEAIRRIDDRLNDEDPPLEL